MFITTDILDLHVLYNFQSAIGANAKKLLKAQFKKYKLACGDAKQPMTFEKWNASRVRMQEMRKGKNG